MKIGTLLEYNCNSLLYSLSVCPLSISTGWTLETHKNTCTLYTNVNYITPATGIIKC